jgi:hypothetical protein
MMSGATIRHYNNIAAADGLENRIINATGDWPEARETFQDRARQEYITDEAETFEDPDELSIHADYYADNREDWSYTLLEEYADALQAELAESGQGRGLEPKRIGPEDTLQYEVRGIPRIAPEHLAEGFEELAEYFVDSSGFGSPGELALTQGQFLEQAEALIAEHGGAYFCITSAGQFQVYVGAYRRTSE